MTWQSNAANYRRHDALPAEATEMQNCKDPGRETTSTKVTSANHCDAIYRISLCFWRRGQSMEMMISQTSIEVCLLWPHATYLSIYLFSCSNENGACVSTGTVLYVPTASRIQLNHRRCRTLGGSGPYPCYVSNDLRENQCCTENKLPVLVLQVSDFNSEFSPHRQRNTKPATALRQIKHEKSY